MNQDLKQFVKEVFEDEGCAYDFGYGDGKDMKGLKEMGWKVFGFDKTNGYDFNEKIPFLMPVDLVYSNFVIQFIDEKEIFMETMASALRKNGYIFIQTMDESDTVMGDKTLTKNQLRSLLEKNFKNINIRTFELADTDHTHVILEATAQKKEIEDGDGVSAVAHH